MGRRAARTLILDTGALIAVERADRRVAALLEIAGRDHGEVVIPVGVLAQAWRGGRRSARIGRLLGSAGVVVPALHRADAQAVGELCSRKGTSDVIDASVVLAAREHVPAVVVTSDPDDLRRLDPDVRLVAI